MKKETVTRQIKYVEDNIKIKESMGKDATFEMNLIKSWKRWRELHGDIL